MKKYSFALVVLLLIMVVTGCSSSSSSALMNATLKTQTVKSGSGASIGTCAYIKISKNDLEGITFDEYQEFIQERVSSEYNWVSIICSDGTGIIFPGGDATLAQYGKLDNDGSLFETYGYINLSQGTYEASSGMESYSPNFLWLE